MELTKDKLDLIDKVLSKFEERTMKETGVNLISGGFAIAEMFGYDDEYIDIILRWGIQSDCENRVNWEQFKLPIEVLIESVSINTILNNLKES